MVKIIKRGAKPSEKVARVTCGQCGSVLEFEKKDVQSDQREGDYVKCPVCTTFIANSVLNWKTKRGT